VKKTTTRRRRSSGAKKAEATGAAVVEEAPKAETPADCHFAAAYKRKKIKARKKERRFSWLCI